MTFLTSILAGLGIGGLVAAFVARALLRNYVPAYLSEKGKNLASKEDIEALTKIVETVKTEQALVIEAFKSSSQLRVAAIDKRLEIHQQAYELWHGMLNALFDPANRKRLADEAYAWWVSNNLYLEPRPREAFRRAIFAMGDHHHLLTQPPNPSQDAAEMEKRSQKIQENFQHLMDCPEAITQAVALPGISNGEAAAAAKAVGVTAEGKSLRRNSDEG